MDIALPLADPLPTSGTGGPGFAVVDVETTGFSPERDRIVEIGVVLLGPDGDQQGDFVTLLDPGRGPGPTHVHGITEAMLEGAPDFAAVRPHLAGLFDGRVVVGHNVDRFDLPFVLAEFSRAGGPAAAPDRDRVVTVDTLRVARDHLGLYGKATLSDCCARYGLTWSDHHSALGDALVTADLLAAVRGALGDEALSLGELLAAANSVRWPGTEPVAGHPGGTVTARLRPTAA